MMDLSPDLLQILVCPETRQPVHLAPVEVLAKLVARQKEGRLLTRAGKPVAEAPEAALVREDGTVAYLVLGGIPVMLADEAVALDQAE